jgi:hypothetical protein
MSHVIIQHIFPEHVLRLGHAFSPRDRPVTKSFLVTSPTNPSFPAMLASPPVSRTCQEEGFLPQDLCMHWSLTLLLDICITQFILKK